jgi:hypothetical protein
MMLTRETEWSTGGMMLTRETEWSIGGMMLTGETEWSTGGMMLTGETWSVQRKTCPNATLSTTNLTWNDLESKPILRGERPATKCFNLSCI